MSGKHEIAIADIERSVLGTILVDPAWAADALNVLSPEDFCDYRRGMVFRCIGEMQGKTVDCNTVLNYAESKGLYERVGGAEHLSELVGCSVPPSRLAGYCKEILDRSLRRQVIDATREAHKRVSEAETGEEALEIARASVYSLGVGSEGDECRHISDLLPGVVDDLDFSAGGESRSISTGFHDFDRGTTGFFGGELYFFAARPGMGKTTLALKMALHISITTPVIFFSIEMPYRQLIGRHISGEVGVPYSRVRRGEINQEEYLRVKSYASELYERNLFVDCRSSITAAKVRARATATKTRHGLGAIFVDYLQLMRMSSPTGNRVQDLEDICRDLKEIAKDLDVPVIVLSQLSRSLETRTDKRPVLSDLRGSGGIEQAADGVYFIYWEGYYDDCNETGDTEIIVGKGRFSGTGYINIWRDPSGPTFRNHGEKIVM